MAEEGTFPLDPEKVYYSMDELTLDTEEGPVTLRMGAWLNFDPVRNHKMINSDKILQVDELDREWNENHPVYDDDEETAPF